GALQHALSRRDCAHARQRAACRVRTGAAPGRRHKGAHAARRGGPRPRARCGVSGAARRARRDRVPRRPARRAPPAHAQGRPGPAALRRRARAQVLRARFSGARRGTGANAPRQAVEAGTRTAPVTLAQALFSPRAVALVGASGDAAKNSARPLRFLRKHGYAGRIVPINASRSEVLGEHAFSSLAEAPGAIDHAFIMTPGDSVERAIEECGARGVPVATIFSDGFADAGAEGAARQAWLVARARELGVRVLGPNSMGLIDVPGRVALSVNAVLEMDALPAGTTSFVSQSGTMLGSVLSRGAALDAYFRDCGIVRVDLLETLIEIAPLLAGRTPPNLPRAARVAVVTTTGGGAASVVDRLGVFGIETVAPDSKSPIIDLTMTA